MHVSTQIIYSRHYNIGVPGIERLHSFDARKYGHAYRLLRRELGATIRQRRHRPTKPVSRTALLRVHTSDYLQQLRDSLYLARALELPPLKRVPWRALDWIVLRPMRWAAAGTMLATHLALQHGLAINLSGGYHHAGPERGEGFCIYADAAIAIADARAGRALNESARVVHIDCDAHMGNGLCHCFAQDKRVFLYDVFNRSIYPAADATARRRIDHAVPLAVSRTTREYLESLKETLPKFLDGVSRSGPIQLAIYNAGTDILAGDTLGCLGVSFDGVVQRDQFVLQQLISRGIPTVMLPSGGYTTQSHSLIAAAVSYAVRTW